MSLAAHALPESTDRAVHETAPPAAAARGHRNPDTVPDIAGTRVPPSLVRHPQDGFLLADPFPMLGFQRRILHGLIRAHAPDVLLAGDDAPAILERIERAIRVIMAYMPGHVALGLSLLMILLDQMPRLMFRSWRRIATLPPAEGRATLDALMSSRFALVHLVLYAVRGVISSAVYDQDEAWKLIGYDPFPHLRGRIDLRQRMLAGETPRPEDHLAAPPHVPAVPGVNP